MVEVNNGNISTIVISILTAFSAAIIADPTLLGQFGVPAQYITVVALIVSIVYNALYPRQPAEQEE